MILDGKKLSSLIQEQLKSQIAGFDSQPGLAVILVGDDPASKVYVGHKQKACDKVGIYSELHQLSANASQEELHNLILTLNQDPNIHGILLQLPLPEHLDAQRLLDQIDPKKDVDGFHPYNLGCLTQRHPTLRPCTPYGIMLLLEHYDINVKGLDAVVVGASNIVGRPMALELLDKKATVTVCHSDTKDLAAKVASVDLLVVATGKPDLVDANWIKDGAIVIDVGIHRAENNSLRGDLDFAIAEAKASYITPVPGGVGPMTIAALLKNTVQAYLIVSGES